MFTPRAHHDFIGAKLALFVGDRLLCLHRDDRPGLLWRGFWDLPGGGREAGESPLGTALRETSEEFGLTMGPAQVRWGRPYVSSIGRWTWFFVGWLPAEAELDIVFGNEGQGWTLMPVADFLTHEKVVPQFQTRLKDYRRGVMGEVYQEDPPPN